MEQAESLPSTEVSLTWRRVAIFCLLAFAISGSAALYIAVNGGLAAVAGMPALLILALWYMPGPALAHLLTRAFTREGWSDLWLRPRFRHGWRAWVVAWFLPSLLVIAGAALYFVFFPQHFDPAFGPAQAILDQVAAAGTPLPFGATVLLLIQAGQGVILAPLVNALPTLGEEFGWRGYLQPKLLVLGWRRAMLVMGVIWGVWHWPLLAMGYNYGLEYAGAPWWGMLAFVWFTTTLGIIFGWLTLRAGSVWPAVIGHGALNGIAALPTLVMQGNPNPLFGPLAHGLVAGITVALVAAWLWWHPPIEALSSNEALSSDMGGD